MRQRRKRITLQQQQPLQTKNNPISEQQVRQRESRAPMFMEQLDYKMEIQTPEAEAKLVLLKNQEFTEEEKHEAFKKKQRKRSDKDQAQEKEKETERQS